MPRPPRPGSDPPFAGAVPSGPPSIDHDDVIPPPVNAARLQRRAVKFGFGLFLLMLAIGIAAGFLFRTDYVAFIPGTSRDTEPFVSVGGIEDYPSAGEIHLTTVRVRDRVSLWAYLWYQVDDDVELVPRDQVFGARTVEENRQLNLDRMASSKDLAISVALEELGYDTIVPDGVFVIETVEGTPAQEVLEPGDVIVAVEGEPIVSPTQLVDAISSRSPGDGIAFDVERHTTGQIDTVRVILTSREDDATKAFLGVATSERVDLETDDLGFDVSLGSDNIGGPSAGLAFTLAVLDQLTPGELTGGVRVAVTGTIQVDGSVGSVGGVEQKAAAVRDEGIPVFLVPGALGEQTLAAARERVGDKVDIVPVDDLDDALGVLGDLGGDIDALAEFAAGVTS